MDSQTGSDGGDDNVFIPKSGRKWESRLPPFVIKIYEMVDDPETNSYIKWNPRGTGFVILDHNKFSAHVLPTIFKTSNFSSFVYQLNSYGFKKISWERYEYANQWFQAGKKHWLKNIKRRNQLSEWSQSGKKRARLKPDQDSTNVIAVETKLDALIDEQHDMQREIQKLKQNLDDMEDQLASLEIPKLSELNDEKMEKVDASDIDNSKRPRLDAGGAGEPADNTENTDTRQFWKKMLEDEAGFDSNEGQEDLAFLHSEAMMELDEMMEMQKEAPAAKSTDLYVEDDGPFELWT